MLRVKAVTVAAQRAKQKQPRYAACDVLRRKTSLVFPREIFTAPHKVAQARTERGRDPPAAAKAG